MHGEESRRKRRRLGLVAFWLGAVLLVVVAIRSISVTDADRTGLADEASNRPVARTIRVKTVELHTADSNRPKAEERLRVLNPDIRALAALLLLLVRV
jgi:hypothetical protein